MKTINNKDNNYYKMAEDKTVKNIYFFSFFVAIE